ncbi:MAG TPA: RHS repeat-associated core domain-containing protein [Candidatus Angelobacter sp.]|nr:RHS repeat-associated core domain-containing protein [Candidatus Angelobacter sp.]
MRSSGTLPFGDTWYVAGNWTKWKFTTYERDAELGNIDYAHFRSYYSTQARFMGADPLGGSLDSPQSLNRYTYVSDDPVNLVDPLGLTYECRTSTIKDMDGNVIGTSTTCTYVDDGCVFGFFSCAAGMPWDLSRGPWTGVGLNLDRLLPPNICVGMARVLGGNPATAGKQGGVPNTKVAAGSAAAIPKQFGGQSGLAFKGLSIQGTVGFTSPLDAMIPELSQSFSGITDTIGSSVVPNVQQTLMQNNPGKLILELVTGHEMGTVPVHIQVPATRACPAGTQVQ